MPYDSRDEQLRIFGKVLQLTRFTPKLGQPKVSNWFAWNSMAETQVRESNATKCIFASSCVEDVCLDDDGPFDSACKDPKAQLQAILKGGGGIALHSRGAVTARVDCTGTTIQRLRGRRGLRQEADG